MRTTVLKLIPLAMLALALHAPAAWAQSKPGVAERLHGNALASFREARFSEAYGRFIALADAGHAPSAELALWMYRHGPSVFGRDWDSSQEQLTAWAALVGQPAPLLVARAYPQGSTPASGRAR